MRREGPPDSTYMVQMHECVHVDSAPEFAVVMFTNLRNILNGFSSAVRTRCRADDGVNDLSKLCTTDYHDIARVQLY